MAHNEGPTLVSFPTSTDGSEASSTDDFMAAGKGSRLPGALPSYLGTDLGPPLLGPGLLRGKQENPGAPDTEAFGVAEIRSPDHHAETVAGRD